MSRGEWDEAALRAEASYFHSRLFQTPIPGVTTDRYVRLHHVCLGGSSAAERRTAERVVQLRLDAEAIEYAFRLQGRKHLLTQKLHALIYLAEVRGEYYSWFFNERAARAKSLLRLAAGLFRAAWKGAKGAALIQRYRLD